MIEEILKVYPNSEKHKKKKVLYLPVLMVLYGIFFLKRLFGSIVQQLQRHKSSSGKKGSNFQRYSSLNYDVEKLDILQLPLGNCWRQLFLAVPQSAIILDVACSTGYLGKYLIDTKECIVDGIEIDKDAARIAAESYGRVFEGPINEVAKLVPDRKYHVVLFMDILEHLVEPDSALHGLKGKLSKDGIVIASVPNVGNWLVRFEIARGRFEYGEKGGVLDKAHVRFFTLKTLVNLFESCGYSVNWVAATMPGWHSLYQPLHWLPFGDKVRLALLKYYPELLSLQFLICAKEMKEL